MHGCAPWYRMVDDHLINKQLLFTQIYETITQDPSLNTQVVTEIYVVLPCIVVHFRICLECFEICFYGFTEMLVTASVRRCEYC